MEAARARRLECGPGHVIGLEVQDVFVDQGEEELPRVQSDPAEHTPRPDRDDPSDLLLDVRAIAGTDRHLWGFPPRAG